MAMTQVQLVPGPGDYPHIQPRGMLGSVPFCFALLVRGS